MSSPTPAPVVFFSWQIDLPTSTNRDLIERTARAVCDELNAEFKVSIQIDADVPREPGSPDIAERILEKIDRASAVIADVSIIGEVITAKGKRAVPNPNVMVEVGYAKKALGVDRVIMLFNDAYGRIETLPFDIRGKTVHAYTSNEEGGAHSPDARALHVLLKDALLQALNVAGPPSSHRHLAEGYQQASLACHSWKNRYFQCGGPEGVPVAGADIWDVLLAIQHPYTDDAYRIYAPLFTEALERVRQRLDRVAALFNDVFPPDFRLALLRATDALETEQFAYSLRGHFAEDQLTTFLSVRFQTVLRTLRDLCRNADARRTALVGGW